jgi:FMN phosphatase YigB (HAD superfamily)
LLIIFDLDDTLIDTSGFVTPFKMKECLEALISAGVNVADFKVSYAELLEKNRKSPKSTDAFVSFAKSLSASEAQIQLAYEKLFAPLPDRFQIPMTPHAKEILDYYHRRCLLAIVTGGHPPFQWDKLKKAGIDSSFFSMIAVPEDSKKKPYYEALQRKFDLPSQEIWVCGDRIEMDLKPAFELGFNTIHMRWGRGASLESEEWIDHSVKDLSELKEIIK